MSLTQDLRLAVRMLRKSPGASFAAATAMALAIGANTAMFSVAYGILLRPLPYAGADRVAAVYLRYFPRDFVFGTMCMRDFLMWKENNHAFEEPSLFRTLRIDFEHVWRDVQAIQGRYLRSVCPAFSGGVYRGKPAVYLVREGHRRFPFKI